MLKIFSKLAIYLKNNCYFPFNQMACLLSVVDQGRLKQHIASLDSGMVPAKRHSQGTQHSSYVFLALFTSFVDNMCLWQRALLVSPQSVVMPRQPR